MNWHFSHRRSRKRLAVFAGHKPIFSDTRGPLEAPLTFIIKPTAFFAPMVYKRIRYLINPTFLGFSTQSVKQNPIAAVCTFDKRLMSCDSDFWINDEFVLNIFQNTNREFV